jgi:ADP-heptose:LPS heptosyltransferase
MQKKKKNINTGKNEIWIYPDGGYSDILILSGVLKQCYDKNPQLKYCLVRRAAFTSLLNGHPAIKKIDFPPENAYILKTSDVLKKKPLKGIQRPYQIMAKFFGLQTPVEEILYLPDNNDEDRLLTDFLPEDQGKMVIIAPTSVSPRKMMDTLLWQNIAAELKGKGIFVVQAGLKDDTYIKGTYSLLGMTTSQQLISLLKRSDAIICVDNFIMHAAHIIKKPAVIIWGPTHPTVYGYPEHTHIQCPTDHCEFRDKCLGPEFPDNCITSCMLKNRHCMNMVSVDKIIKTVIKMCSS